MIYFVTLGNQQDLTPERGSPGHIPGCEGSPALACVCQTINSPAPLILLHTTQNKVREEREEEKTGAMRDEQQDPGLL